MKKMFLVVLFLACFLTGCSGPGMISSVSNDMLKLMDHPTVKQTMQNWSARADVTNPAIEFYMINGVGARATGLIVRGDMTGGGTIKNAPAGGASNFLGETPPASGSAADAD